MSDLPLSPDHDLKRALVIGLCGMTVLFSICALKFELRWESNDDIAMAMVAGGYGIAALPSPNLFFSNILWGHLVQLLDGIGFLPGYSIASLAAMFLAGTALLTALVVHGVPRLICAMTMALMLTRPLLFQQFTINAGLVCVAAVLCWHYAASRASRQATVLGAALLFMAFLIRAPEACLVLLVAAPLLPWSWLRRDRPAHLCLVILAVGLLAAQWFDRMSRETPEWQNFNALNLQRAAFTDFGARRAALLHPQLMRAQGFSVNDIELVSNWFFVDPKVSTPSRLHVLLASLGSTPLALSSLQLATRGIANLWHRDLLPLFAAALLLAITCGGRRVAASWALCLLALLALGIAGRPGGLRVYYPLLTLLLIAPLLWSRLTQYRAGLVLLVLTSAAVLDGHRVTQQSRSIEAKAAALHGNLTALDQQPVVTWGAEFPFEAIYPLAGPTPLARNYRLYGLGVFTLAPFSRAAAEEAAGTGFVARLTAPQGILIVANPRQLKLLANYCTEHFGGALEVLPTAAIGTLPISRQRCRADSDSASTP
jgi:hypothetical protein